MNIWVALVLSLPTTNGTVRTRVWRQLKAVGAGVLRDGVYLLPDQTGLRSVFEGLVEEVVAAGGSAQVVRLQPESAQQLADQRALFDRTQEHRDLLAEIRAARKALRAQPEGAVRRALKKLRKDFDALEAIDYFAADPLKRSRDALREFEAALAARLSPGEPTMGVDTSVELLDIDRYQGRTWATRARPGIDRLASAWLIARFIDRAARFNWFAPEAKCPAGAIGYDFDNAHFTHRGQRVTFEVLLASFGLGSDNALLAMAGIVHFLDVGDTEAPAEAAGIARLCDGLRSVCADDGQMLAAARPVFDALYQNFLEVPAHV